MVTEVEVSGVLVDPDDAVYDKMEKVPVLGMVLEDASDSLEALETGKDVVRTSEVVVTSLEEIRGNNMTKNTVNNEGNIFTEFVRYAQKSDGCCSQGTRNSKMFDKHNSLTWETPVEVEVYSGVCCVREQVEK